MIEIITYTLVTLSLIVLGLAIKQHKEFKAEQKQQKIDELLTDPYE